MTDDDNSGTPNDSAQTPNRPSPAKRPERGGNQNVLFYAIFGLVILILTISFFNSLKKPESLECSDFLANVKSGKFHKGNVFDLKIGQTAITFQDRAVSKTGDVKAAETKRFSIPALGMTEEIKNDLIKSLDKEGITWGHVEPPSEWGGLLVFFAMLMVSTLVIIFVIRRLAGPGSAMSIGRSRGKLYAQEELGVTFEDVAGADEAVEELREIVEFLRTPAKYLAIGGRIPRGVLLVGPPGTGKTLLAKAVAGEAGVPFFSLSGSDFVEMFVGVGASRVRDLFSQAMQRSPAIIFIDELDALGKRRGEGGPGNHDERDQTLNALLVEMDGFSSDLSVIVMGATNRPETLDPALMRPGRFDRHVLVDRPDVKGREAILNVHIKKVKTDDTVDVKTLAKITPGFVGADLANLVNEAALLAARKNKTKASKSDFQEGVERVVAGLEKRTRIIPEDEKQRVAYHEIGHTLVALTLPHVDPVHKVSIIPRGFGALGYMLHFPEKDRNLRTKTELHNSICVMLGGIAVENLIFQEGSTGPANDLERATEMARSMVTEFGMSSKLGLVHYSDIIRSPFLGGGMPSGSQNHSEETIREIDLEIRKIIDSAYQTAFEVVSSRRDILERLTQELLEVETMDADQIKAIVDAHTTGPVLNPGTIVEATTAESSTPVPASGSLPATGTEPK